MRKDIWIWGLLLVLLLASLPGIINRSNTELENKTYNIAVPLEEIYSLTTDETITMDKALSSLRKAGLTTVSLNPFNLYDLELEGIITIYNEENLSNAVRFSDEGYFDTDKKGYYITVPEASYYNDVLKSLQPEEITVAGEPFYFIPEEVGLTPYTSIGYDEQALELIEENDLNYILRVRNDSSDIAYDINEHTIQSLVDLKNDRNPNILFSGQEVIGYPDLQHMNQLTEQLNDVGFRYYTIEFTRQLGLQALARNTDYNTIRLHSIDLNNKTLEENIDQAVRAVKERHIRSIFFHIQTGETEENLENAAAFVAGVNDEMPARFNLGTPEPFEQIATPLWMYIIVLLSGILFTYISSGILKNKWARIASVVFMSLLSIAYLLLQKLLLLQAFALIIAVITPIYAVLSTASKGSEKISKISMQYVKAILISFIGILIVVGVLNGNAFITGFEVFRGVKLVYVIPILFVALFLFFVPAIRLLKTRGLHLLQAEVKYWHLLIFGLIGAVSLYYISRTGNAGSVSNIELMIRTTLEDILYVRPRTKEFLIGFPFYILALYVMRQHFNWGKILLIPGVIGFLSIMNTFTHFHIPLHLSLLRTVYSVVLGYLIGLLFIYVYKYIARLFDRRWT